MAIHNQLGDIGEKYAVDYLQSQEYEILETNWRYIHKELDIVALDGDKLVVVEVKTRSRCSLEDLRDIVSLAKMKFLVEATNAYIEESGRDEEVRFDIIFITQDKRGTLHLEHLKDAFNILDI